MVQSKSLMLALTVSLVSFVGSAWADDAAPAASTPNTTPMAAAPAAKPAAAAKPENNLRAQMKAAADLADAGKTDEAIAAYEKIGVQKSKKAETWRLNMEGLAYLNAKTPQVDKAIALFEKATQVDKNNAVAWNNLGTCYEQVGKVDKAKEAYQAGVDAGSDKAKANLDYLEAKTAKKAPDEASADTSASAGDASAKTSDAAAASGDSSAEAAPASK